MKHHTLTLAALLALCLAVPATRAGEPVTPAKPPVAAPLPVPNATQTPATAPTGKPVVCVQLSTSLSPETAKYLWDNKPETQWRTPWGKGYDFPHDVVVDLGAPRAVTRVGYLRGQNGPGAVKDYEVYAGSEAKPVGDPVARGAFKNADEWQYVDLAAPSRARYVVLRCLSAQTPRPGGTETSIAELRVVAADALLVGPDESFSPPQRIPDSELGAQYTDLVAALRDWKRIQTRAATTFHPAALVTEADRDPADVVARRTAALLADLRAQHGDGAGRAAFGQELAALREQLEKVSPYDGDARYAIYERICQLRRRIAFGNPLLGFQEILFLKRYGIGTTHQCDQYYGIEQSPGGGLYVLRDPFAEKPKERDILKDSAVANGRLQGRRLSGTGSFLSPALSFDAKRLAFAYVECEGHRGHTDRLDNHVRGAWSIGRCYHIFTANLDGSDLRMLTDGTWNDFSPCFMPSGRIAFISERRGGYVRCGRACPSYALHDMAADGSDIRRLSFHETNEWSPAVRHDGMMLWTRWDYVDRVSMISAMLWTTTPDGRNPRPVHGNYWPVSGSIEVDARPIPGSGRLVATVGPHHGQSFGTLIMVDPNVKDDDGPAPMKRLTPQVGFPEGETAECTPLRIYGQAWPLSEEYYLCVYRSSSGKFGLYLLDVFGNQELLWNDPKLHCLSPMVVRPVPVPPVLPELPRVWAEGSAEATVTVLDVYESLKPWPTGAKVSALRIMQLFPMPYSSVKAWAMPPGPRIRDGLDSTTLTRASLGTVPVEADGSAHFVVPAGKPLFFQALDAEGLAITSMRSETHFLPGERAVCQGCHEPKHTAPPSLGKPVGTAMRRPPSRPQPEANENAPISFPRLVQPVLDKHCVACHAKERKAPPLNGSLPANMRNGQPRWFVSYENLLPFAVYGYGNSHRTIPGKFGARVSKLYPLLSKGHHDVKLSADELRRLTLWLDSMSPFYGVYDLEGQQAELRGEYAKPPLE